jgi:hypothetical protein
MLLQWCYFGAGIVALIALREKSDNDAGHEAVIFDDTSFAQLKRISSSHDAGHEAVIFDDTSFAQLKRISSSRWQGTVKTDIDEGRRLQTIFETEEGEESNKLILRCDS